MRGGSRTGGKTRVVGSKTPVVGRISETGVVGSKTGVSGSKTEVSASSWMTALLVLAKQNRLLKTDARRIDRILST